MAKSAPLPRARALALDCVDDILTHGNDLQAALDARLRGTRVAPADAGLCTELVYGYIRLKLRVDALLGLFLKNAEKLPVRFRLALGLAAYEMLFLDRIPVYASVDWCVAYGKQQFSAGLGKLANAVLRNLDRLGEASHSPESVTTASMDRATALAIWYSCPEWIVRLWLEACGEERTLLLLTAGISPAPVGLRVNPAPPAPATTADAQHLLETLGSHEHCLRQQGWGLLFPAGSTPTGMKTMLTEGRISRQSMASQQALTMAQPDRWEGPVWDCCCGRGGKTTALLEAGIPVRFASDTSRERLRGMREEMERLGLESPFSLLHSAAEPVPDRVWEETGATAFGTVLADVPCSGLGTLSRRPDARYHRTPDAVAALCRTQAAILDNAYAHIRPGGRVVYMTCTVNPAENGKQVAAFLQRTPGAICELEWETASHGTASEPDMAQAAFGEFFYVALLRRG